MKHVAIDDTPPAETEPPGAGIKRRGRRATEAAEAAKVERRIVTDNIEKLDQLEEKSRSLAKELELAVVYGLDGEGGGGLLRHELKNCTLDRYGALGDCLRSIARVARVLNDFQSIARAVLDDRYSVRPVKERTE